jgi:two-component system cell cycle response regulator
MQSLPASKTLSAPSPPGSDVRVLIADDDATSRLLLKAMASKLGHECLVANDGSTAWAMLESERIDVLLTDWMMPGLDGPELCRRVRDELSGRYIYIVLITGLDDPGRVLEGMGAGADDYLIKPVDPFAVQTRLVAAERVTLLHRQVADFRAQLERANFELLGRSLTDALTGLGNRRRMEEDLGSTHARARRTDRSYGVALFDIDHFKLYNDHYGHLAGDDALRQVARCLDQSVRSGESVYRYGGEEFLLILPGCTPASATTAAERVRKVVKDAAIPHAARPTSPPLVTLSGGVSCWTAGSAMSVPELLRQADDALFRAKLDGRNRIHVATPIPSAIQSTATAD